MTKIQWLTIKANENKGFFKATFTEEFINQVNVEAMELGAIFIHDYKQYTWTSKGQAYSLTTRNPKHKGQKGTVTFEVYNLENLTPAAAYGAEMIDKARELGIDASAIATMQQNLSDIISQGI